MKRNNLSSSYLMVNIIKNKVSVKYNERQTYVKVDLYTFTGIDLLGNRHMLGTYLSKNDDNRFYLDIFESFKSKGVKKIYFIVIPQDEKLVKGIKISFPTTDIVDSLTMNIVNLWTVITHRGRSQLSCKIRHLYTKETYQESEIELSLLKEQYNDNSLITLLLERYFKNNESYYKKYNQGIRDFIFNHNSFTDLHDTIRKISDKIVFNDIEDIQNHLSEYFERLENNKPYTKKQWVSIINSCNEYFNTLIEEMVMEV